MAVSETDVGNMSFSSVSVASAVITIFSLATVVLNFTVCCQIYRRRGLRSSSTAIIVANLACVDILVTLKDIPMFIAVSSAGKWYFEESWCSTYGLTNVIFIIVSVSTLVTVTTERYVRLRDSARNGDPQALAVTSRPILLGYVIAHTTLSYSLSLLWSKYVFVTRKAFCHVEWPPRQGFSFTFLASFIFIVPVSILIYNLLYRNLLGDEPNPADIPEKHDESNSGENQTEMGEAESRAHNHLQVAVSLFLVSWSPYVLESILSGYIDINTVGSISTACVPLIATSLLPYIYMKFLNDDKCCYIKGGTVWSRAPITVHVQ